MARSVRLYTAAQSGEVKALAGVMAGRSGLSPAGRDRPSAFRVGLRLTVREDRRRAVGAARLPAAAR